MKKKWLVAVALSAALAGSSSVQAQFASSVVSYVTGTGFAANFTNSNAALGAPASSGSVTPFAPPFSNSQIMSIGTGGSLTLQFNTPIVNDPSNPYGIDFLVFGNSFFVISGGTGTNTTTSGAVFTSSISTKLEVSSDNVNWYTLNPSLAPTVGTFFPTDGPGNPLLPVNPLLASGDFAGKNLAGIRTLYNGSAGGAGFDLAWAQDEFGNGVFLPSANYLRIDVLSGRTQIDAVSAVPEPTATTLLLLPAALGLWRSLSFRSQSKGRFNS
jgi:hypothetical protein